MHLTLSSKGQIVLPAPVRRRLRLKPGARLNLQEKNGGVFLSPVGDAPLPFEPIDYPPPGSIKFSKRDYDLDRFADAMEEAERK